MSIFDDFLKHLQTCQGCIGERTRERCPFVITCAYVEKLVEKGEIRSSAELLEYKKKV